MIRWITALAAPAALACALVAAPAQAQTTPRPGWDGVWQGTVGNLPVRACFSQRTEDWSVGSYYYLSRMRAIPLRRADNGSWTENGDPSGTVTGTWALRPAGNRMTGEWRQGSRRLAVNLTQVPAALIEDGACASPEFMAPRQRPVTMRATPKTVDRLAYSEEIYNVGPHLPDVTIRNFSFVPRQPGDRAINTALRINPRQADDPADYLTCLRDSLGSTGSDGGFDFLQRPTLASRDFLVIEIAGGGSCGGAHPYTYGFHRTFDRRSGQRIDLSTWFSAAAVIPRLPDDGPDEHHLTPAFRTAVLAQARGLQSDCREVVEQSDYWDIALTRTAMEFTPGLPHVAQACADPITMPFAAFSARLSAAGRAGLARLARSEATE
jgi:hypothetical protein